MQLVISKVSPCRKHSALFLLTYFVPFGCVCVPLEAAEPGLAFLRACKEADHLKLFAIRRKESDAY